MISRYEVSLNDLPMSEIDPNLLVLDVSYADPSYAIDSTQVGGRDGAVILNETKESANVTITFELHIYSIAERQRVCQLVNAWAKDGGILRINDRPEQRLNCVCIQKATVASARGWTDPLSITFAGYKPPYWEDETPSALTISGRTASGSLYIPGNGKESYISCSVVAKGTLTAIRINAGSSYIELSGISIPNNGTLTIDYLDGVLRIRHGNTSLLSKRTGASSDDLRAACGANCQVSIVANVMVAATFSARGCWT